MEYQRRSEQLSSPTARPPRASGGDLGLASASRGKSLSQYTEDSIARVSARLSQLAETAGNQAAMIEEAVNNSATGQPVTALSDTNYYNEREVKRLEEEVGLLNSNLDAKDALIAAQRREIEALKERVAYLESVQRTSPTR